MPRPINPETQQARRTQILNGVERLVAEAGLGALTMQRLIAETGISAGSVYHHFKGKDDILMALVARGEQAQQELLEAFEAGHGLRPILIHSADAMLAYLCDPTKARLLVELAGAARSPAPWAAALRAQDQALLDALTDAILRDRARRWRSSPVPPDTKARLILALWEGLVSQAASAPFADIASLKRPYLAALTGVLNA